MIGFNVCCQNRNTVLNVYGFSFKKFVSAEECQKISCQNLTLEECCGCVYSFMFALRVRTLGLLATIITLDVAPSCGYALFPVLLPLFNASWKSCCPRVFSII
jgi:hypothetical protein